ncbi:hypothetical protein HCR_06430 [Hydrogenimonas cancrithermarum]|uniref:Fis family transcriptional regulator n=1 Tax=Hydrogenimonas cancrithermarum TaxID=2993563 RepID=A0ABN6WTZ1_9BACT|nr:hypothetical protein HCR_06430 [Hydrogenimonas cancrithermarum]
MVRSNSLVKKAAGVAQDVAAINFIASSKPLKEALKSANLLKTLKFNTLISGEHGTGRHTLASLMMPDVPCVHGDDAELYTFIENSPQLIVDDIGKIDLYPKFFQTLKKHGTQIIAIADETINLGEYTSFFSVRITLPPLKERPEDIIPLAEKFKMEALHLFGEDEESEFELDHEKLDISGNAYSLRKSVFLQYLASKIGKDEILDLMEAYITCHLDEGEEIYRRYLYLYEVPLIKAGTKRFKSQLKMSQVFGLNRNTLRKKINEWKEYL